MNMNKFNLTTRRGVTLVELLVAVSITTGMMLAASMVFSSSTKAAGLAQANTEIMAQLRALTDRLDRDFTGLQPNLPMAIIFEIDPSYTPSTLRQDRIVFFANGDFQVKDYGATSTTMLSGNLARIFYGQADYSPALTNPSLTGSRYILMRREKLLTADTNTNWNTNWLGGLGILSPLGNISSLDTDKYIAETQYDYMPIENTTEAFWKNETAFNFQTNYFQTDPDNTNSIPSMVRRPNWNTILNSAAFTPNESRNAIQQMYLLPDVTDLKIQVWFLDPTGTSPYANRWFPDDVDYQDMVDFAANPNLVPSSGNVYAAAFYWNVPDLTGTTVPDPITDTTIVAPNDIDWWSDTMDLTQPTASGGLGLPAASTWPSAIRFTFTLYDKDRRHYPNGQTFSYIVKLPPRN